MLAANPHSSRRQHIFRPTTTQQPYSQTLHIPQQTQSWSAPSPSTPILSTQPQYISTAANSIFNFGNDQTLYDYTPQIYNSTATQPLMQSESGNANYMQMGPLTPKSTTRTHHRESSLSSLGSAGPASPYTANIANPQVAGDLGYHELHDFQSASSSKPLTPAHTPQQEHFLTPQYSTYYPSTNFGFTMGHDGLSRANDAAELMPAPAFDHSARPSIASVASHDSPSTPPSYEEERGQKNSYRSEMPKLERTMTDVFGDNLYRPDFQITSAPSGTTPAPTVTLSPQNDVFSQRLQTANSQHLSASNIQPPLMIPSRERSPFRQGSPLAPTGNSFASQQSPNVRFGTATHMREQQKLENDRLAFEQQIRRTSPQESTPKTISPKDVNLVYHESEEDSKTPLFPQSQSQTQTMNYRQQPANTQEIPESDDNLSHQSFGSMATTRRESSSAYSATSHPQQQQQQQQNTFNFVPPAVAGSVRQMPNQYPFVAETRRQASNLSNTTEDFPATLTSMESSSSEYAERPELKKPAGAAADTGTYTCTYHGCTLRFDTPQKLQRHKREGHRNSAIVGSEEGGMTSAAQRNSQAGPHRCERINPSTGKPCNTDFSRPYDLTRHEDTIHNARKQKVHCPVCTEEKTFSRNDALTRHMRVVHPDYPDPSSKRRRGGGTHG